MTESSSPTRLFFEHQPDHLGALLILVAGLVGATRLPGFSDGELLGLSTSTWVVLAVANAVVHQVFVWFCWRGELHGRWLSRTLGRHAFGLYAGVFAMLIVARPVLVTILAISNAGTLPGPRWLMMTIAIIAAAPGVYLIYSVKRYFGFRRTMGIDHFDTAYRSMPLERRGIFRFSRNAMYVYGFLILWVPGLWCRSVAALCVTLFCHLYIWVHYFCTERPDMRRIYGPDRSSRNSSESPVRVRPSRDPGQE